MLYQQMSMDWVKLRLRQAGLKNVEIGGFSRHLLYYNYAQPIDHKEHFNGHTPSNFWGAAKIDEVLDKRVMNANAKNGYK